MDLGRKIMAATATAMPAMIVKRYMKKIKKEDKRNRQTDIDL
ncbi:MAG TPA: hypothetical protein VE544_10595 [Nitrososphaeraceae archaeon]|nr:hypothetical protein [Nitrososphaeraceae archaeon]